MESVSTKNASLTDQVSKLAADLVDQVSNLRREPSDGESLLCIEEEATRGCFGQS